MISPLRGEKEESVIIMSVRKSEKDIGCNCTLLRDFFRGLSMGRPVKDLCIFAQRT